MPRSTDPRNSPHAVPPSAGLAAVLPVERYLKKLDSYPLDQQDLTVSVVNPMALSRSERSRMLQHISQRNFVIYQYNEEDPALLNGYQHICHQLGLTDVVTNPAANHDGVTTIETGGHSTKTSSRYIPFSNKSLNWHTDGYYNDLENTIRAFVLHCRHPAETGGTTQLIDHELIFALLYRQNPMQIESLSAHDVMTIPANIENGKKLRDDFVGPVFARDALSGQLLMRYTERKRNIHWKEGPLVSEALDAIKSILKAHHHWGTALTLQSGQGVIANNVLHNRSAFTDSIDSGRTKRKLERIRFSNFIHSDSVSAGSA